MKKFSLKPKFFSCDHYPQKKCHIRAPCCNNVYSCRLCHDEQENHNVDRYKIKKVICNYCLYEQDPKKTCVKCYQVLGEYFCSICNLFDNDTSKKQFHCDKCGICRIGGKENFFHCDKCNTCLNISIKDNHKCIEKSMHQNCPICMEFMFDSREGTSILRCGHSIHSSCLSSMLQSNSFSNYKCPICNKAIMDLKDYYQRLDQEIAATPLPDEYKNIIAKIFCNECEQKNDSQFHFIGLKCINCGSYNTKRID